MQGITLLVKNARPYSLSEGFPGITVIVKDQVPTVLEKD